MKRVIIETFASIFVEYQELMRVLKEELIIASVL